MLSFPYKFFFDDKITSTEIKKFISKNLSDVFSVLAFPTAAEFFVTTAQSTEGPLS
jgi:hypothetical protein